MSLYGGFVVPNELQTPVAARNPGTTYKRRAIKHFEGWRLYAF
jgi:hypothetical protein